MIIESMKPSSDQLQKKNVYVVKMETTGLEPDDEILELCVIDARNPYKQTPSGREVVPLFHSRFRPEYKSEWPNAQRRHGISPEMVARARFLSDYQNQLVPLFMHCDCLVCFNADFDFSVLRRFFMFRTPLMTIDLMRDWTDIISKPGDPGEPRVNIPFQSQRDLFTHFNWPLGKGLLSDCVGLRHCFLQLIPTGGLHIRRPLLERRFARSTSIQLKAVEDNFASELQGMRLGPTLKMEESENGELIVRIGMNDPEHVLLDTDFPEIVLTLDPTGSAGEVRKRVAQAVQEQKTLTLGLRKFLTDIVLGLRPKEEEESEDAQGKAALDTAADAAREAMRKAAKNAAQPNEGKDTRADARTARAEAKNAPQADAGSAAQAAQGTVAQPDAVTRAAPKAAAQVSARTAPQAAPGTAARANAQQAARTEACARNSGVVAARAGEAGRAGQAVGTGQPRWQDGPRPGTQRGPQGPQIHRIPQPEEARGRRD